MEPAESSCEITGHPLPPVAGSHVFKMGADYRWEGVPTADYKQAAEHHCGVTRMSLAGERGEGIAFHTRYFELAPGGFTSLEHHEHEHVVVVMRGRGEVKLGNETHALAFGDVIYVAPHEVHQFRNPTEEPFGFLCIVDANRDRPVIVTP